jgi:hypothetical protein
VALEPHLLELYSNKISQYVLQKHTDRLRGAGTNAAINSVGDSFDDASTETHTRSKEPGSFIGAGPGATMSFVIRYRGIARLV